MNGRIDDGHPTAKHRPDESVHDSILEMIILRPFARMHPRICGMPLHIADNDPSSAGRIRRQKLGRLRSRVCKSLQHGHCYAPSGWRRSGIAGRSPCPIRYSEPLRRRLPLLNTVPRSCRRHWHRRCKHRYNSESYPCSWLRSRIRQGSGQHSCAIASAYAPYGGGNTVCADAKPKKEILDEHFTRKIVLGQQVKCKGESDCTAAQ